MALAAGTVWEVRTTGNADNGGGFIDRLPGTSVDYSQQNASQLSCTDLVGTAVSITVTSVIGGFTPGMVGNLIQIRAGLNFTVGFYEIVQLNSPNSVNLDRIPCSGAGSGGTGEVGGALISPETPILNAVSYNTVYVKSGTYTFTALRIVANTNIRIFGYDTSRDIAPTVNNRPLIQFSTFYLQTNTNLILENFRFTGSATQLILGRGQGSVFFNCYFENTNNAGNRYCIYYDQSLITGPRACKHVDCEFVGTAGATSYGFRYIGNNTNDQNGSNISFEFCFFHDLTYGFYQAYGDYADRGQIFLKCTFARIGIISIYIQGGAVSAIAATSQKVSILFCSFYSAGTYHVQINGHYNNVIYGNTFDGAVVSAIFDSEVPNNDSWYINSNNFWNNGASVIGCNLDANNIGLDPLWVNPAGNDFNFGPGSPCIDNALGIRLGV